MVVSLQSLLDFFMAKNNLNNNDGNIKTVIKVLESYAFLNKHYSLITDT